VSHKEMASLSSDGRARKFARSLSHDSKCSTPRPVQARTRPFKIGSDTMLGSSSALPEFVREEPHQLYM
jgi:hypothetical protein